MGTTTIRPDAVVASYGAPALTGAATYDAAARDNDDATYASFVDNGNTTVVLRANGYSSGDYLGLINPFGGGSAESEVSDNSDSTGRQHTAGVSREGFYLDDISLPPLAQIIAVRLRSRLSGLSGTLDYYQYLLNSAGETYSDNDHYTGNTGGSVVDFNGSWRSLAPDGGAWTAAKVNDVRFICLDNAGGTTKPNVREIYLDVEYELPPCIVEYSFGSFVVPSNAQVRSVTPRIRHDQSATPDSSRTFAVSVNSQFFPAEQLATESALTTQTGLTRSAQLDGSPWSQSAVDALTMKVQYITNAATSFPSFKVAELYLDVLYNQAMIPLGAGPNALVSTTRPTFSWRATDPENDAQERYRVKVFADYQYTAAGFNPNTATPLADSGEVFSADTSWTVPTSLYSGHTYRAYVWLADAGSSGRYNIVDASGPYAWATIDHTGPGTPLAAPAITLTAPPSPGDAVEISIAGSENELSTQSSNFEGPSSSSDVGAWLPVSNATLTCLTGVSGAPSGSGVMDIHAPASGDSIVRCGQGLNAVPGQQERWGVVTLAAAATPREFRAELHWFDAAGAYIDTTYGNTTFDYVGAYTPAFVHGQSIYNDAAYVALGVTIFGATAGEHHYLDTARLSPNPINQLLTPGFDIDSDGDGVADGWTVVDTGGDPAPVTTIDRAKAWGGVSSQRIDWPDNNGTKGLSQSLDVPSGAIKFIQVWVAFDAGPTVPTVQVHVTHDFLPDFLGPVAMPADGKFHPLTFQATNSASFGTGTLKIVCLQGGPVSMWFGEAVVLDQDSGVGGDFGSADFDATGYPGGGPKDIMSGYFAHGGAVNIHYYELQRSVDNGASWVTLPRVATTPSDWVLSDLSGVTPAAETQIVDAFDFEAPTLVAVLYRARALASLVTGELLISNWSRWVSVTPQSPGWQLISINNPDDNLVYEPPLEDLEWKITYEERGAVEHPLGRSFEVVMSDAVTGAHIPFDAAFTTEEEYAIYTALRTGQTPMIFRNPWGEQFYCRFVGSHSVQRIADLDTSQTLRTITASLIEIDVP